MQIDRWSTHSEQDYEEPTEEAPRNLIRPRASLLNSYGLKEQRVIPNPSTPIPARASAQAAGSQLRTRRTAKLEQEHDVTGLPTMPPPAVGQRHEIGDFLVESSVPSLSLARWRAIAIDTLDTIPPPLSPTLDELDTIPPPLSPSIDELDTIPPLSPSIDELDTIPPLSPTLDELDTIPPPLSPALDELDTVPPHRRKTTTARNDAAPLAQHKGVSAPLPTVLSKQDTEAGVSWTTAQGKDSWLARRVASKKKDSKKRGKSSLSLNPVERLRWWLLYPGRIEFLLWFNGAIVLFAVTFFLLFAMILSMGWLHIGGVTNSSANVVRASQGTKPRLVQTPCTTKNVKNSQCHATTASSSGLQLTLVDNTVLYAGTPIYLHGQGFSANGTVALTYDAQLPCLPNITQTDGHGTFSLSLVLGADVQAGKHQIHALDMASSHAVNVTVDIAPSQSSKLVTPPLGPTGPGATTPATGGGHGGTSKPVEQTPVPVAPTVGVSPTPASTPTVAVSPSPTVGTTPTASATSTPIVTKKSTDPYLALRNTLYNTDTSGHFLLNPWLWVAIIGYMLSMTMLGLAGLLYRRKRRLPLQ